VTAVVVVDVVVVVAESHPRGLDEATTSTEQVLVAILLNFFSLFPTKGQNKLECLSKAILINLV
jgi:hypothetical protein